MTAAPSPTGDNPTLSPKRTYRETPEVVKGICRMVRSVGRRVAEEDTDGLEQLQALDAAMATAWATAIDGLRRNYSDGEIGKVLGVSRQAVRQRWPRPEQLEAGA